MNNSDQIVLHASGVRREFDGVPVLHDVNLEIAHGQMVAIVGESGCGKSVLLSMILGTLAPSSGSIQMVRGSVRAVIERPSSDRGVVYQAYQLMPFLNVLDNVTLGIALKRGPIGRVLGTLTRSWPREQREAREAAETMLVRMGLGDALKKYPDEMSGGMRQRVAIAQSLLVKPEILLLDEPFGALDEATREQLQQLFLSFYWEDNMAAVAAGKRPPLTVIIVTHQREEALLVGDRVIGLSKYWDWKREGHAEFPGATVVYDWKAPVERMGERPDAASYRSQIDQIHRVVAAKDNTVVRGEHVQFWNQVAAGEVDGVLSKGGK